MRMNTRFGCHCEDIGLFDPMQETQKPVKSRSEDDAIAQQGLSNPGRISKHSTRPLNFYTQYAGTVPMNIPCQYACNDTQVNQTPL